MSRVTDPDDDNVASLRHSLRLLGRGLVLRCPNCGKGPVLKHWFKLQDRCGHCHIQLERGEHDYFMGSLLLNYSLTGLILVVTIFAFVLSRSEIPWTLLQWGAPAAVVILPAILFPFTKLLWLAADLIFRPEPMGTSDL